MINTTKNIRNFCIIAHIDHGKSTLSDRMIEVTKTVAERNMKAQLLDQMDIERERGITIKLQPVQMDYVNAAGESYTLNLIDTPGHVDFAYEVSRSLAAVEGAVLLVDATQGVQAQTLTNLYFAWEHDLEIIPVINKIDLPNAEPEKVMAEIVSLIGCAEEEILSVGGKTGEGVPELIDRVVDLVPAPEGSDDAPVRALVFDSIYDSYKGVMAYVRVIDGQLEKSDHIHLKITGSESSVVELGHFRPAYDKCDSLGRGDIGYIATGFKSVRECRVGDTITVRRELQNKSYEHVEALDGYKEVQPMVYASFYPHEGDAYDGMRDAMEKLELNDAAFRFEPESNVALGRGFRCGFLGLLHLEIIQERLRREFDIEATITTPSVVYQIKKRDEEELLEIYSPLQLPDPSVIESIQEPYAKIDVLTPSEYMGNVMELMTTIRSEFKNTQYLEAGRVQLTFEAPLMDVIVDFHDQLKSVSSGYASMHYEPLDMRPSDVVKMDIIIAGDVIEAFARIVPRQWATQEGKQMVSKLKEVLSRQNFTVAIQAAIGGKIIARETLSAYRKDVTAKLYGGDITRKRKLLEKQKAGKKRMGAMGKVDIPPDAFVKVLRK